MTMFLLHLFKFCFLIVIVPGCFSLDNCNFKVNVDQNLRNNGFHRNLSYTLSFVNDYDEILTGNKPEHCYIGLEQILPTGLYFRGDEVRPSIVKTPVNIEDSAEEAKSLTIQLLNPVSDWMFTVYLPLHARYHAANAEGGKIRNVIQPPKIYLNCKDERLLCDDYIDDSVSNNFCQKGAVCRWIELPIVVEPNVLTWDVPVGNTQDYYVVAAGTAASVVAGSLYLLSTVHEYMMKNKRVKSKIK